jgi:hypothetical protein
MFEKKTALRLEATALEEVGWNQQTQWVQHDWKGLEVLGSVEGYQTHYMRNLPGIRN